jgi:hypothetical protein
VVAVAVPAAAPAARMLRRERVFNGTSKSSPEDLTVLRDCTIKDFHLLRTGSPAQGGYLKPSTSWVPSKLVIFIQDLMPGSFLASPPLQIRCGIIIASTGPSRHTAERVFKAPNFGPGKKLSASTSEGHARAFAIRCCEACRLAARAPRPYRKKEIGGGPDPIRRAARLRLAHAGKCRKKA